MTIREYAVLDHAVLVDLFRELNQYEDSIAGDRRTDRRGAVDSLGESLARVAETGGVALVAELRGVLAGFLFVTIESEAAFVREELRAHAHVADFFVREAARRTGVGRSLMAAAEGFAAKRGLRRLTLSVLRGNAAALAAYERLGFAACAVHLSKAL